MMAPHEAFFARSAFATALAGGVGSVWGAGRSGSTGVAASRGAACGCRGGFGAGNAEEFVLGSIGLSYREVTLCTVHNETPQAGGLRGFVP